MNASTDPTHPPEIELLLTLSRLNLEESHLARCRELLERHREEIHWDFFVDQAARHRLLPLVARHITRHRLYHGDAIPYPWLYPFVYNGNKRRNQAFANEFGRVLKALNGAGAAYAVRKGPVLGERLYGDPALRVMNDLDLLVERQDTEEVGQVLTDLGYSMGRLSSDGSAIEPFSRRTQIFWRTNTTNVLPYVKMPDHEDIEAYFVDIGVDIFQKLADSTADTGDILKRRVRVPLCGEHGYVLAPADQFIDLCVNLHTEATALYYIAKGNDIEALKFLDIALSCRQLSQRELWPEVRKRATELQAEKSVYYAMHHSALLHPRDIPAAQLTALRPPDTTYLNEYGTLDGKHHHWQQPFWQRAFDPQRKVRTAHTTIPHT